MLLCGVMLSIDKSREILGNKHKHCSDKEIEEIRDGAHMLANIFIEGVLEKKETTIEDNKIKS